MSRTITAMFDSRQEAEAARAQLAGQVTNVQILDQSSSGASSSSSSSDHSGTGASDGGGFWASVKEAFMPHEDRHAFEEGVRRGGYLLCATVDESQADQVCSTLENAGAVDFDGRQEQWRSEGWRGYEPGSDELGERGQSNLEGQSSQQDRQRQGFAATSGTETRAEGNAVAEERIPLIEEQLRVGKREVERGGARVRSYIEERPVHEQVNLREEHVSVERRPVDQPVAAGDLQSGDLLKERNIEMTETSEEAVVAKEARVREEVVVKKTAEERTEQIDDTVRRTEVEIDEGARTGSEQDRSAFGFQGDSAGTGTSATSDQTQGSEFERDEIGRR